MHCGNCAGEIPAQATRAVPRARRAAQCAIALPRGFAARNAGDLRFAGEREVELKGLGGSHRVFALDWH